MRAAPPTRLRRSAWAPAFAGVQQGFSSPDQHPIGSAMPVMDMTNPAALPADWRDFVALTKPRPVVQFVEHGLPDAARLQAQRVADEIGLLAIAVRRNQKFVVQTTQRISIVLRAGPFDVGAKIVLMWHVLTC